ncbi:MAG TPA: NUDIX hydrolase [Verrucomicrobiae bacterium]|nr:NUDIX hydrolase [Verrucomicrobiae bacterium]
MPIQPWTKSHEKALGDFRIFRLRSDAKISPRTGTTHDFFVIDCVNWVNVIALTPDHQIVMVEQYRHGSNTVELEIPGGMMDPTDASPEETAVRELGEETGYEGENARIIGRVFPNPAIMSNICYTVLIENCRLVHPISLDSGEDVLTLLLPAQQLPKLVASGKIQHSLVVAALYQFALGRGVSV